MIRYVVFVSIINLLSSCSSMPEIGDRFAKVVGWEDDRPQAPAGFKVTKFADGFRNPRTAYVAPNGDILISEAESMPDKAKMLAAKLSGKDLSQNLGKSANRITLLRDADRDGVPELRTTFLSDLNQPYGMLILNNYFYVANTDGVWRWRSRKPKRVI